jgi:hypothetical protein
VGSVPFGVVPFFSDDVDAGTAAASSPSFLTSSWDKIEGWFTGQNANTTGMSPTLAKTAQTGQSLKNMGLVTAVLGGVSSAIGTYYAAQTAQYQQKSQASSFAFQSDMAAINSSREEMTAESIEEAGKNQIASYTMQAGQQRAGAVASMAARGIALGAGSAADVVASMDVEKSLNVMAINSNTTRQAWAARQQGTNYQNESLLDRTSSVNAQRSASSTSPTASMVNSLLGSATQVAGQWDYGQWLRMRMAQGLPVPQVGIGAGA